jgi:hypothetical protein
MGVGLSWETREFAERLLQRPEFEAAAGHRGVLELVFGEDGRLRNTILKLWTPAGVHEAAAMADELRDVARHRGEL